jgi:hypothetical protein
MNANELADELTKMFRGEEYDRLVHEIPDFLRLQEKELTEAGHMIGILREYIFDLEKGLESSIKLNKAQAKRQEK